MHRRFSGDNTFKTAAMILAASAAFILLITGYTLFTGALPVFQRFGSYFFTGTQWNPVAGREIFGVLPYLLGTLVTSGIALLIGVPISLGIAIFLVEMAPKTLKVPISYLVELLAAVPSVIYGLWGLFVLRFWVVDYIEKPLSAYLGWLPLFSGTPFGLDVLTAGIILAIMIIPTVSSVSREVIQAVPNSIREAAYSIGATKWEVIRRWVLSYGRSGLFGAVILGLGRAVGETMAVTMVIGNRPEISASLFDPSYTMASVIANEFTEATSQMYLSSLIQLALVLFVITIIINALARLLVWSMDRKWKKA